MNLAVSVVIAILAMCSSQPLVASTCFGTTSEAALAEGFKIAPGGLNLFGYSIEFDSAGRVGDLTIDLEALAAHIAAVKTAATANGIGIWRIIFDPKLQPFLHNTSSWPLIRDLRFSTRPSWVRHDEHYHIDFEVPCEPLADWSE